MLFSLFSFFFAFFRFKFFASLRFCNFCFDIFASHKRKPLNFASIQYFSHYSQFRFGWKKKQFYQFFRLIFVSLRFFCLIFSYFTLVFASDFWCFASKWIMWNQAFFLLPSETKFSLQFQIASEAKVRAHPNMEPILVRRKYVSGNRKSKEKNGSANRKSANMHIGEKSAKLVSFLSPQIFGFSICGPFLRPPTTCFKKNDWVSIFDWLFHWSVIHTLKNIFRHCVGDTMVCKLT